MNSDSALFADWYLSLALAAVVIVIAAALLITILLTARKILKLAVAALGLVEQIKEQTKSIWALQDVNGTAVKILQRAQSIKNHGARVAEALHETSKEKV